MGRVTYQGIFDKLKGPLDRRTNIVMTHNTNLDEKYLADGVLIAHSAEEALRLAKSAEGSDRIYVAGGAKVYAELMPFADELDLTKVHKVVCGDAFFPEVRAGEWNLASKPEDKEGYSFVRYERTKR